MIITEDNIAEKIQHFKDNFRFDLLRQCYRDYPHADRRFVEKGFHACFWTGTDYQYFIDKHVLRKNVKINPDFEREFDLLPTSDAIEEDHY